MRSELGGGTSTERDASRGLDPIRVTHLISGDLWAGAEVATFHLVSALAERSDLEISVIALNSGDLVQHMERSGVRVEVISEAETTTAALLRAVRASVRDADLVHAHRYKENLLASLSGRPWVATQHGRPEPFARSAGIRMAAYQVLDRFAKRHGARRLIAVSSEIAQWLEGHVDRSRVVCAWNGIADPQPAVRPLPWRVRPKRVGVVGRLVPVKQFDLAVESVARCPEIELDIVGEGRERRALEQKIRKLGVADRVRLLGHLPDPLPHIASWRALLVPSLHEGNPISVLEALAVSTPVISANLPGVEEILDGRAGWLVPGERDTVAWSDALRRVVRDLAAGEAASSAARLRYLEAFTAEAAAARILAIYEQALRPR